MTSQLAAIEVAKFPWIAFMFLLAYWKTAVAAIWGVGFVTILTKRMRQWYRDDGRDAAIGVSSEEAIYSRMKMLARERRGPRLKELSTKGLFWILYWAHAVGKKLAKWAFYPILAVMDKAQTRGIEEGRHGLKHLPVTEVADGVPSGNSSPAVLIAGQNASQCIGCGFLVAHGAHHECKSPVVIDSLEVRRPVKRKVASHKCSDCGNLVQLNEVHKCVGRAGVDEDGMIHCECGTVYKDEEDFEHVCPEEDGDDLMAECKDCETEYNPTEEVHIAKFCKACEEVHCKKQDCGHVIA